MIQHWIFRCKDSEIETADVPKQYQVHGLRNKDGKELRKKVKAVNFLKRSDGEGGIWEV